MIDGVAIYWIGGGAVCQEGCAFEVRFGDEGRRARAYLTADYGHDNPGTLVDVEVSQGALVVNRTLVFPPGSSQSVWRRVRSDARGRQACGGGAGAARHFIRLAERHDRRQRVL